MLYEQHDQPWKHGQSMKHVLSSVLPTPFISRTSIHPVMELTHNDMMAGKIPPFFSFDGGQGHSYHKFLLFYFLFYEAFIPPHPRRALMKALMKATDEELTWISKETVQLSFWKSQFCGLIC
uniref:Uncharacterized protein n=1 Tax=Sphaerodactylus townsendi TaxID=933632 RepID=A0ACB8F443_9SAUR